MTLSLALFAVASGGPVYAQQAPRAPVTRGPGRDALDRGLTLLRQQRWVEAMPHLEESVRLEPTPLGWFNLALAYRGAGRVAAAVGAFERYLAAPEADAPAARLTAIRGEVAGLLRSVGRLQVSVTPASATIRVDGRDATTSGGELRVDPGTHALAFEAPGYETLRREVTLQASATMVLELLLHPVASAPVATAPVAAPTPVAPTETAPPPAPATGRLAIDSSVANAVVSVDGSPRGVAPLTLTLPPGEHQVELRAGGYRTWTGAARVAAGGASTLSANLAAEASSRGWILPVAIGGGAAVVTAVVIGVAFATRGAADPTRGSWDTRQEP